MTVFLGKSQFDQFMQQFQALVTRVEALEKENSNLKSELSKKKEHPKVLPSFASLFKNEKNNEFENVLIAKCSKELKVKEKKEKNVILTGLPKATIKEDKIDEKEEEKLLTEILIILETDMNKVKSFSRVKNKQTNMNEQSNPMVVEFVDIFAKNAAMKNSSKLKTSQHKVFINHDLTEAERVIAKQLRDERNRLNSKLEKIDQTTGLKYGTENEKKFHYGIRNNSIRKIFTD